MFDRGLFEQIEGRLRGDVVPESGVCVQLLTSVLAIFGQSEPAAISRGQSGRQIHEPTFIVTE